MSSVLRGAKSPEAYELTIRQAQSGLDLSTVSAVSLQVRRKAGTVTWTTVLSAQSSTSLKATHTFAADGSDCPRVLAVEGDALGGARITLDNGMTLEIWPADTDTNECAEHWRFFRNTDESPHFVVTTAGVVDD